MPANLSGDRWLTPAWLSREEDTSTLADKMMDAGWGRQLASDISHLVKLYQWGKNNFDPNLFYDLKKAKHGMTNNKIKDWMKLLGYNSPQVTAYFMHDDSDLQPYVNTSLGKKINPEYISVLGKTPQGDEFEKTKRILSTKRFTDSF